MVSELEELIGQAGPDDVGGPDLEMVQRRVDRRRTVRIAGWLAAAVLVSAVAVVGLQQLTGGPAPEIVGQPGGYAPRWTPLVDAPLDGRANPATVWTDEHLIVWGGGLVAPMGTHPDQRETGYSLDPETGERIALGETMFSDGAIFDPRSGGWQSIADAPFTSGYRPQAVWTGSEMIVVTPDNRTADLQVGAYDPTVDSWRAIDHPVGSGAAIQIVWTGEQMLLWGTFDHQASRGDIGYAYDPSRERWRELPDAPVAARQSHTAVWTGTEMIVWGGTDLVGEVGEDLGGAAYDPESDSWRRIASAPVVFRSDHTAVWAGTEMIVWGGRHIDATGAGAAYDPASDTWRPLPSAPIEPRLYHVAAWDGQAMIVWGGTTLRQGEAFDDGAAYMPATDRWMPLPDSPLDGRCDAGTAVTPSGVVVWGGTVGCDTDGTPTADGALIGQGPLPDHPPRVLGDPVMTLKGPEGDGWKVNVHRGEGDRWCINPQAPSRSRSSHQPERCNQAVVVQEGLQISGSNTTPGSGLIFGITSTADRIVAVAADGQRTDTQMADHPDVPFDVWAYGWEEQAPVEILALEASGEVIARRPVVVAPGTVEIPDVVGLSQQDAVSRLEASGIDSLIVHRTAQGESDVGMVLAQDPEPGTAPAVPPAQATVDRFTVTLVVGVRPDGTTTPD